MILKSFITTLPSLVGRSGEKPLVWLTAALPLVEGEGLGKGISALCTLSQFIALVCIQVPPLDLCLETKAHKML